ncbi:hypothetical protein ACI65C_013258 [Semiaphis heraclei]
MSLSKSTKRRKCLEECEELGLAIESSEINYEHLNVTNQPSTSYEHESDHEILNNCEGGNSYSTNFSTESNHSDSEVLDQHLTVDKVIDDRQNDIILVPTFSSDSDNCNECYSEKINMDSTLYSVVYFNDDNTVECVPNSWIKNGTCAWPSKHINARKMIEQNCTPNKNEFNFYKIRELCSNIKTLAEAQFKARKAQFTSDLSDNDYSKKKKLKRKIPNPTECPIYSGMYYNHILVSIVIKNICLTILDKLFKYLKIMKIFIDKVICEVICFLLLALTVDISHHNLNKDPLVIIDTSDKVQRNLFGKSRSSPSPLKIQWSSPKRKKDVEFKKQIMRNIMYLKVELKHVVTNQSEMLEKLQTIEKELQQERPHQLHTKNVEFNNFMADYHLPIDNEDDLNTLDEKTLNDQEFKNNLIKELSCTGGKNVKSAIKRIMSKLFTNSFLSQYSFSGKKGKKKFCNLFLLPIILKSIKKQLKFINISDHDIEEPIKTYLAQAPFAEKRKKND